MAGEGVENVFNEQVFLLSPALISSQMVKVVSDLCLKYFSKGKGSTLCLGPNNLDLRKLILSVVETGLGTGFCNDFDGEIGF